jgi:predicted RNA-binding protein with RPS1 domain
LTKCENCTHKLGEYKEGLIHISEVTPFHLDIMDGIFEVGEIILVIVSKVGQDKIGLSIKQIDPEFANKRNIKNARPLTNKTTGTYAQTTYFMRY